MWILKAKKIKKVTKKALALNNGLHICSKITSNTTGWLYVLDGQINGALPFY